MQGSGFVLFGQNLNLAKNLSAHEVAKSASVSKDMSMRSMMPSTADGGSGNDGDGEQTSTI